MNFDGAKGYLIGPPNKGLNCMFTFMNTARLSAPPSRAWRTWSCPTRAPWPTPGAPGHAQHLTGPKNPDGPADPIIVHPDVRRMLLTQKALAEGSRAFLYFLAMQGDIVDQGNRGSPAKQADDLMALLTPIAKAFMTETGFEAANLGVQVFGGHGFIKEWGMEQIVRDARIAMLYEGTLIGRKVLGSGGKMLLNFTSMIDEPSATPTPPRKTRIFIDANCARRRMSGWSLSMKIGEKPP